jgi:hypothetical protein
MRPSAGGRHPNSGDAGQGDDHGDEREPRQRANSGSASRRRLRIPRCHGTLLYPHALESGDIHSSRRCLIGAAQTSCVS